MRLREFNWTLQEHEEVEYPDGPIKDFIDWLRNSKAWQEDSAEMIYDTRIHRRFLRLQEELTKAREAGPIEGGNGTIDVEFTSEDPSLRSPDSWDA